MAVDASAYQEATGATSTTQPYDEAKLSMIASQFPPSEAPLKTQYEKQLEAVLTKKIPVLALLDLKEPKAQLAQQILLESPDLNPALFEQKTGKPFRVEVMSVQPALPGDRVGADTACWEGGCFRVDLYNFFYNATVTALVDTTNRKVVSINSIVEAQPELSQRLKNLAREIATHEPAVQLEVEKYLRFIGEKKKAKDVSPVMIDTKSALRDTLCERSKHLCVAPTYVLGDRALWVIVDLTDLKVVGLRWTKVGDAGPPTVVTERTLENHYVFENFCQKLNSLERAGWTFDYHITTSDGLRIADARFNKKPVFKSAKVVDWHVSYSRKDKFGYSDATGCPMFSSAVVVAFDGPEIAPIMDGGTEIGFSITQDFRQQAWPAPCNYRYEERYEFYRDGRFRTAMTNHGRGCGDYATYRPILRINWGGGNDTKAMTVERWMDEWKTIETESWFRQKEDSQRLAENRFSHRLVNADGDGYAMAPSYGQFDDGGRGDNAFIYFSIDKPERHEGERDLITLGSCCNTGYEQGPEQFLEPAEPLADGEIILWYVPQLKNDGTAGSEYCWAENQVERGILVTKTWPCTGGPMFVPIVKQ